MNIRRIDAILLLAIGLLSLGWTAFVLLETHEVQKIEIRPAPSAPAARKRVATGDVVGRLSIPRLSMTAVVLEGTGRDVLRVAAGHVRATALPGSDGNIAIAAHRDTLFSGLAAIRSGDVILLEAPQGTDEYRVEATEVVSPRNTEILNPSMGNQLTLITCYPFHFIGPAPKRFIVHALRVTRSGGAGR